MKQFYSFILITLILAGCTANSNRTSKLDLLFSEKEIVVLDQIIEFYDEFVYSKTSRNLPIQKAYLQFLDSAIPKAYMQNDLSYLSPEEEEEIEFYKSLDQNILSEIFIVKHTAEAYNYTTGEYKDVDYPYYLRVNYKGKIKKLLEALSAKNEYYKETNIVVEETASFSAYVYSMLPENYKKIDYSLKEERLVFIAIILVLNKEVVYH